MEIEQHRENSGMRIKELRETKGWTKSELGNRLGMKSYTSVTRWEDGSNLPRGLEIIKMAEMFDVSTDYLLGLSNNRK